MSLDNIYYKIALSTSLCQKWSLWLDVSLGSIKNPLVDNVTVCIHNPLYTGLRLIKDVFCRKDAVVYIFFTVDHQWSLCLDCENWACLEPIDGLDSEHGRF